MTLHSFIFLLTVTLLRIYIYIYIYILVIILGHIVAHSFLGVEDKMWLSVFCFIATGMGS